MGLPITIQASHTSFQPTILHKIGNPLQNFHSISHAVCLKIPHLRAQDVSNVHQK